MVAGIAYSFGEGRGRFAGAVGGLRLRAFRVVAAEELAGVKS